MHTAVASRWLVVYADHETVDARRVGLRRTPFWTIANTSVRHPTELADVLELAWRNSAGTIRLPVPVCRKARL